MQFDEVIERVRDRADLEQRDPAWDLTCRTLETLAECVDADTASKLAAQLPRDLQGCVKATADADRRGEGFGPEEFARRVAQRVGYRLPEDEARDHVSAVMSTLSEAVTGGQWVKLLMALPPGYSARI